MASTAGRLARRGWRRATAARRTPTDRQYPRVARVVTGGVQPVQTAAGVVLGATLYALMLNWIRGGPRDGPAQARGWILAKLINKPYQAPRQSRPGNPTGRA